MPVPEEFQANKILMGHPQAYHPEQAHLLNNFLLCLSQT